MIKLTSLFSVFFFCIHFHAMAQAPAQAAVQKELGAVLQAPYQNKWDVVMNHMHPNLVKISGGEEALKTAIRKMFGQIKEAGVGFVSAEVGVPYSYMKSEQREFFLVDVNLVLSKGDRKIASKTTQIVIKDKDSKIWSYTDASGMDEATLRQIFPDTPKEFSLKKKKEPAPQP